jgi:hypothetical protein
MRARTQAQAMTTGRREEEALHGGDSAPRCLSPGFVSCITSL